MLAFFPEEILEENKCHSDIKTKCSGNRYGKTPTPITFIINKMKNHF